MNGKYSVASVDKQDVPFNDDYASKGHEYFDVWAPEIATVYGENFWTSQNHHPIPADIVARFKGKVMAITGYEQDQVLVNPVGRPGLNPQDDLSVPINWAYNHHYMAWMSGDHSEFVKNEHPDPNDHSAHGGPQVWVAVDKASAARRVPFADGYLAPTSQMFSEGNGGESRKSFHGYPAGFAQLIDSPTEWHLTPMQIDTRRRDCGVGRASIHNCTKFEPWIEPKQARYGRGPEPNTNYSGVLECPCNSRFGGDPVFYPDAKTKVLEHQFGGIASGSCASGESIFDASSCFAAAPAIGLTAPRGLYNVSISDVSRPGGCFVERQLNGTAAVVFNAADSSLGCAAAARTSGAATSLVNVTLNLTLDADADLATVEISGPSAAWFGVGFSAADMADAPYTIYVNSTGAFEQKIGTCGSEAEHCAGDPLAASLTLLSSSVIDGRRTVTLTRKLKGLSPKHYSFDPKTLATLPFITAVGKSQSFAYHAAHHAAVVTLAAAAGAPTCLCDKGVGGKMCEFGGKNCAKFTKDCRPAWDGRRKDDGGDLLTQANPSCNSRQYSGGLRCCGHKRILIDHDQDGGPDKLRYHMKFRFWFQEYVPATAGTNEAKPRAASHLDLPRYYYQTEANSGEYDIPPAFRRTGDPQIPGYPNWPISTPGDLHLTPGTTCTGNCPSGDDCACEHTITYHFTLSDVRLYYAGGHCHAPSCLSLGLWNNASGTPELLCHQEAKYGQGDVGNDRFDEAGYVVLPPCLWGAPVGGEPGLAPSIFLAKDTPVFSIKRNRNTYIGHFGEMASWQMRGVPSTS